MRYQKLKEDLETIEDQPKPYSALRVEAATFNIIGWLMIALHLLITIVIIYPFMHNRLGDVLPSLLLTFLYLFLGLLFGIGVIAAGQIIELALDVGNDVHITRRYIRRIGLFFARSSEHDKQE